MKRPLGHIVRSLMVLLLLSALFPAMAPACESAAAGHDAVMSGEICEGETMMMEGEAASPDSHAATGTLHNCDCTVLFISAESLRGYTVNPLIASLSLPKVPYTTSDTTTLFQPPRHTS